MARLSKPRIIKGRKVSTYDEILEDIMSYRTTDTKFKSEKQLVEFLTGSFDRKGHLSAKVKNKAGGGTAAGYVVNKSSQQTISKYVDYLVVNKREFERTSSRGKRYKQESYQLKKTGRFVSKKNVVKGRSGNYYLEV